MAEPIITLIKIEGGEEFSFFRNNFFIPFFLDYLPQCLKSIIETLPDDDYVLGAGFWRMNPLDKNRLSRIQVGITGTKQIKDMNEKETMTREVLEETGLYISPEVQDTCNETIKTTIFLRRGMLQEWYALKIDVKETTCFDPKENDLPFDDGHSNDNRRFKVGAIIHGSYKDMLEKMRQVVKIDFLKQFSCEDNIGWIAILNVGYVKSQKPFLQT